MNRFSWWRGLLYRAPAGTVWGPVFVLKNTVFIAPLSGDREVCLYHVWGEGLFPASRCEAMLPDVLTHSVAATALGFVKSKGASRRTRHEDTMIYLMQAWGMEPGQRILEVRGGRHQIADCLTKVATSQVARR